MENVRMTICVGGMFKIIMPHPESKIIAQTLKSKGPYHIAGLTLPKELTSCSHNVVHYDNLAKQDPCNCCGCLAHPHPQ
jgi:hypothetical protein